MTVIMLVLLGTFSVNEPSGHFIIMISSNDSVSPRSSSVVYVHLKC